MKRENDRADHAGSLMAGLGFGVAFGFLLQKGGVGKYSILMGQLLLQDWTVLKIMLSAVVVGMVGVYSMKWLGWAELRTKETAPARNIAGGLIFGVGFGLSAYCPGTNLSALGQGNWDALAVAAGLLAGSYLYAGTSERARKIFDRRTGDKRTLPEVIGLGERQTVAAAVVLLLTVLLLLELST